MCKIYKRGDRWCAYQTSGGRRKLLKCFPTEAAAKRYRRAIFASQNAKKAKSLTNEYNRSLVRLAYFADDAGGHELDDGEILDFIDAVYRMLGLDPNAAETVTADDVRTFIEDLTGIFHSYNYEEPVAYSKSFNLRRAIMVTSNAYEDREGEIVKQKALGAYVEHSWDGDTFVGNNPLYVWHGGDPIGSVIYADMIGPFLLEFAQERPDTTINLAESGQAPIKASVKSVWDALAETPDLRASHRFGHILGDEKDGAYDRIFKLESSVLSGAFPANWWTYFRVL